MDAGSDDSDDHDDIRMENPITTDDFDYPLSPMAPEDDVMSPLSVRDRPRPGDGSDGSGGDQATLQRLQSEHDLLYNTATGCQVFRFFASYVFWAFVAGLLGSALLVEYPGAAVWHTEAEYMNNTNPVGLYDTKFVASAENAPYKYVYLLDKGLISTRLFPGSASGLVATLGFLLLWMAAFKGYEHDAVVPILCSVLSIWCFTYPLCGLLDAYYTGSAAGAWSMTIGFIAIPLMCVIMYHFTVRKGKLADDMPGVEMAFIKASFWLSISLPCAVAWYMLGRSLDGALISTVLYVCVPPVIVDVLNDVIIDVCFGEVDGSVPMQFSLMLMMKVVWNGTSRCLLLLIFGLRSGLWPYIAIVIPDVGKALYKALRPRIIKQAAGLGINAASLEEDIAISTALDVVDLMHLAMMFGAVLVGMLNRGGDYAGLVSFVGFQVGEAFLANFLIASLFDNSRFIAQVIKSDALTGLPMWALLVYPIFVWGFTINYLIMELDFRTFAPDHGLQPGTEAACYWLDCSSWPGGVLQVQLH